MDFLQKIRLKRILAKEDSPAKNLPVIIPPIIPFKPLASDPQKKLSTWVAEATEGENRALARDRILYCYNNKQVGLCLRSLGLKELPDVFNQPIFIKHLMHLDIRDNLLTKHNLPSSIKMLIDSKNLNVLTNGKISSFSSTSRVVLIPTRKELEDAQLTEKLWWKDNDYLLFKNEAGLELKAWVKKQEAIGKTVTVEDALAALYQPPLMRPSLSC